MWEGGQAQDLYVAWKKAKGDITAVQHANRPTETARQEEIIINEEESHSQPILENLGDLNSPQDTILEPQAGPSGTCSNIDYPKPRQARAFGKSTFPKNQWKRGSFSTQK